MAKLKSIEILFFAKLAALMMAIAGLICGVLYAFGGFFFELFTDSLNPGTVLAFLAIPVMPLIFASCGFIAGVVGAVLYNVGSKWFGGIESGFNTD